MKKVKVLLLGVVAVILVVSLYRVISSPKKVTDKAFIAKLEAADDNLYQEEKAMLANIIQYDYKYCSPEKVVFFVQAPHEAWHYTVEIYYKDQNGTWYLKSLNWTSMDISGELDKKLITVAQGS